MAQVRKPGIRIECRSENLNERSLGLPVCKWEDNIKRYFEERKRQVCVWMD